MDVAAAAVAAVAEVAAVVVVLAKVLPSASAKLPEAYIPEYLHDTSGMLNDLQTILSNSFD